MTLMTRLPFFLVSSLLLGLLFGFLPQSSVQAGEPLGIAAQTDWLELPLPLLQENSADAVAAPNAATLGTVFFSLGGSCPGPVQVTVTGVTPGGLIQFVYGPAGSYTVTTGSCIGMVLDMNPPTLGPSAFADASGALSTMYLLPAGVCGMVAQAVDVTACTPSNPVVL